jgi:hypothetical protein
VTINLIFYQVQSASDPLLWHEVYVNAEGYWCDCLGFKFRKCCRHIRELFGLEKEQVMARKNGPVGVLWLKQRTDSDGKKVGYMSGYIDLGALGQLDIVVFKNGFKREDKLPDYNIVLSEPKKPAPVVEREPGDEDDDIPF